jgi:hypothetical protein
VWAPAPAADTNNGAIVGLFSRKPTGPRVVSCPNCSGAQEIPGAALNAVCRNCNVTFKINDEKITQYSATVSLETCGSLTIEKKGALVVQKRVVASSLELKGSLKGNTIIYDRAHISAGAQMNGDLKARILVVEDGASIKGHIEIIPANGCVTVEPPKELAGRVRN